MENSLLKIVIFNYVVNYKIPKEYNAVKDKIIKYLDLHPEYKNDNNLKSYLVLAKRHINTVYQKITPINVDLEKYDKLLSEIDTFTSNVEDIKSGTMDEFIRQMMEINSEKTEGLYFITEGNKKKLDSELQKIKENLYLELEMRKI